MVSDSPNCVSVKNLKVFYFFNPTPLIYNVIVCVLTILICVFLPASRISFSAMLKQVLKAIISSASYQEQYYVIASVHLYRTLVRQKSYPENLAKTPDINETMDLVSSCDLTFSVDRCMPVIIGNISSL